MAPSKTESTSPKKGRGRPKGSIKKSKPKAQKTAVKKAAKAGKKKESKKDSEQYANDINLCLFKFFADKKVKIKIFRLTTNGIYKY